MNRRLHLQRILVFGFVRPHIVGRSTTKMEMKYILLELRIDRGYQDVEENIININNQITYQPWTQSGSAR